MANINLLPWREERRQELKQAFITVLVGVALVAAALVFVADMLVGQAIDAQQSRNKYLTTQIAELNKQVKEIKELESKKQELLDRMKVIQELQGNRPIIVRIFDELVKTLPDGVFYSELTRTANKVEITGIAESNNRISSLMRNLDNSEWFKGSNLTAVTAKAEFGEQASQFSLSFIIGNLSDNEEEE